MLTIETLKNYGADTTDGVKRCMGDEGFYLMLVQSVIADNKTEELKSAIESGDLTAAFEIAHGMKGMYGNISLTPIYEPVCEITELLRNRTQTDYSSLLEQIIYQKKRLDSLAG